MKKNIRKIGVLFFIVFLAAGCAMNKSFHIPAAKGDLDTIKSQLDGGRDIESRDIAGQTALMYAAESGQMEVVKYLVSRGADVNAKTKLLGLGTALIYAASANRYEVVEYLIENGADVNATTQNEETALFWAAGGGHVEAVKVLLDRGASTEHKNKDGQTALDIAWELNRNEVTKILQSSGMTAEIGFYGRAEEEVDNGTYDKDLWAKALVDAEGDESKRKIRYIELRAKHLQQAEKKAASTVVPDSQPISSFVDPGIDITGQYTSEITYSKDTLRTHAANLKWYFGKQPEVVVNIEQNQQKISGSLQGSRVGKIEGKLEDNKISFEFEMNVPGGFPKHGTGVWQLDDDRFNLSGDWEITSSGNLYKGTWNLFKVE